ncbi:MAG: alpha/beta fold hydrolase [Deltaproteobacteria bacterium]|nr:alpha/beta fold hydrolase [Deltaproteobacteria bacterium]
MAFVFAFILPLVIRLALGIESDTHLNTTMAQLQKWLAEGPSSSMMVYPVTNLDGIKVPIDFSNDGLHVTTDSDSKRVAVLGYQQLAIVDRSGKYAPVLCPPIPPGNAATSVAAIKGRYFVLQCDRVKQVHLHQYIIQNGKCILSDSTALATDMPASAGLIDLQDRVLLLLNQSKQQKSPGLEIVRFDAGGKEIGRNRLADQAYQSTYRQQLSTGPRGILIPLRKLDGPHDTGSVGLYLLDANGRTSPLLENTKFGLWVNRDSFIALRGVRADGNVAVLVKKQAESWRQTVLPQPEGHRTVLHLANNHLHYTLFRGAQVPLQVTHDLLHSEKTPIEKPIRSKPPDTVNLPEYEVVQYPFGKEKLPALRSMLPGLCNDGRRHPAVVFLHGGGPYGSMPDNETWPIQSDPLMLSQLGFVVFQANYYGDQFAGSHYPHPRHGEGKRLGLDRHVDGIVAAGEYTRHDPCVDPERIILVGHSMGAILGASVLSDPRHCQRLPFRGFVLQAGAYRDEEMKDVVEQLYEGQAPAKFLDLTVPLRRVTTLCQTPVYLMHGTEDLISIEGAKAYEKALRTKGVAVTSWYPKAGHSFDGDTQREMAFRIRDFSNNLITTLPHHEKTRASSHEKK